MKSATILLSLLFLFSCASQDKVNNKKMAKLYSKKGTNDLILKNYTEALGNLLKAVEYDDENDEIHNNLGMAYYFKKNKDKAIFHLKKSILLNPKNIDAKMNIATIYMNDGDHAKAEAIYKKSIEEDLTYTGHFRTYYNLSLIEEARNNPEKVKYYLKKSIAENQMYCPSHFKLGQVAIQEKDYYSAVDHFKSASGGTCQKEPIAHYYQAISHLKLRQYESARFKLEEIVSRFPNSEYKRKAENKLASFQAIINQPERVQY